MRLSIMAAFLLVAADAAAQADSRPESRPLARL
jgi:hypothetical protein